MPEPLRVRIDNDVAEDTEVNGFQLWINIPSGHKIDTPKHRDLVSRHAPMVTTDEGPLIT